MMTVKLMNPPTLHGPLLLLLEPALRWPSRTMGLQTNILALWKAISKCLCLMLLL